MVLERGEPGDCLSLDLEGGDAIRDALLGLGEDVKDPLAQQAQCAALRLLQGFQVAVDLLSRHCSIVQHHANALVGWTLAGNTARP
jgi:hypothetical protein